MSDAQHCPGARQHLSYSEVCQLEWENCTDVVVIDTSVPLGSFAGGHGRTSSRQTTVQARQLRVINQHSIRQKGGGTADHL